VNIWLVNPFDSLPGERLRAGRYAFFASLLSEAGHSVTWWTSAFCHAAKSYRDAKTWAGHLPDRVKVIALWVPAYYQNISVRRLINHVLWARAFYKEACQIDVPPDVIVTSSPPLDATNKVLRVAYQQDAKVIIDVQDLWPEAFSVAFPPLVRPIGMALLQPLKFLEDTNFRRADGLIAISQTLLDRALAVAPNKTSKQVIPLGVDVKVYDQALRVGGGSWQKQADEFWVVYIGTIGKTYDIGTILQVACSLAKDKPKIKFFIAGSGPLLQASQEKVHHWGLSNVVFTGLLSLDALAQLLVQADVGLNAITSGAVSAFPNKVFDYLAAGLPVINSVKGELSAFIQQQGLGIFYEAGQAASLQEAILKLYEAPELRAEMGARGYQLSREQFDRSVAYRVLLDLIAGLGN
jgi:glycosyltransferase involved in cell wall biosynthesis